MEAYRSNLAMPSIGALAIPIVAERKGTPLGINVLGGGALGLEDIGRSA